MIYAVSHNRGYVETVEVILVFSHIHKYMESEEDKGYVSLFIYQGWVNNWTGLDEGNRLPRLTPKFLHQKVHKRSRVNYSRKRKEGR